MPDLSGMNLAGKDLTGAQLQEARLEGTVFTGVLGMAGADLSGAHMDGTDFSGCDLSATIFGPVPSFGSSFASLTKFTGATVPYRALGSKWSYVDLKGAVLLDLPEDLSQLEVRQSDLSGADFSGRTLKNAHFYGVVLQGAKFCRSALDNIVFTRPPAHSQACDLTGAEFCDAELTAAVFDTSTLTGADFTGAKLEGASFLQTRMDGTRFDNTDVTTCAFSASPRFSADRSNLTSFRGATLSYTTVLTEWSYLDLTGATLAGLSPHVDLTYLQAVYAVLGGMDLRNYVLNQCDLTGATLTGTDFTGAQMNDALLNGAQNRCELFRVPPTSPDHDAFQKALDDNDADGVATIFSDHGYPVSGVQVTVSVQQRRWTLTDILTRSVYPVTTEETDLVVTDPKLATRFDDAALTRASFSPDDSQRTVLRGVRFTGAKLDYADLSGADLGPVNPHDLATAAQFNSASMNNAGLSHANLTGARLTGPVYLHQANLTGATLKNADLMGAQLGALSKVFRVERSSADYHRLQDALDSQDAGSVAAIFALYGVPIASGQTRITKEVAGRSWNVSVGQASYTVLNWTSHDGLTFLIVSATLTGAATLSGAHLPGATLVDANLYGVDGAAAQFHGADLDGAILDSCKLPEADMSRAKLSVQGLYNVDLTGASLIRSTLKIKADLTQGVALSNANLQGTDFTGTSMNQADLAGAAVAVSLAPWPAGVYLFGVSGVDAVKSYAAELQAAVTLVSLGNSENSETYVGDLNNGKLTGDLRSAFRQGGVDFSAAARIEQVLPGTSWLISDPECAGSYTVWNGFDALGNQGLFSHASLPLLEGLFQQEQEQPPTGLPRAGAGLLRAGAIVRTRQDAQGWMIDNDSQNKENKQLGYSKVLVTEESKGSLAFYGTSLRLQYLDDDDQPYIQEERFGPTILDHQSSLQPRGEDGSGSVFGLDTVCPNGMTLRENRHEKVPWEKMLRSVRSP